LLVQSLDDRAQRKLLVQKPVEDLSHHLRLVQEDLVTRRLRVRLAYVAVTVGSARKRADDAATSLVQLPSPRTLEDLRALVLGDHALHLYQQLVLGAAARRTVEEDHRDAVPRELLEQEHLIGILASESIRAVHVEQIQSALGGAVSQLLQRGSHESRSAVPLVHVAVAGNDDVTVGLRSLGECRDLTADRGLLLLLLRRHARVQGDRLHDACSSRSAFVTS